jgi:hypothetical protein
MSSNVRTPLPRRLPGLFAAALASAALLTAPAQAYQDSQDLLSYARVGAAGAKAYNLADPQAVVVLEVPAETVLAVHGERNGWLDVEAPGGFQVWVWGEYLTPAGTAGQVRVTGNDVRMRPLPSSGIESYALAQKLGRNQELVLIGRNDESKPMASDWVQVWSPPGARAWVRKDETVPLAPGESGAKLWGAAVEATHAARKPVPVQPVPAGQSAAGQAVEAAAPAGKDAVGALRHAETLFAAEKAKDDAGSIPDYGAVRAAYEDVLAFEEQGPSADRARTRLEQVELRAEAFRLRHELEIERVRREEQSRLARERLEQAGNRDPFYGRFAARGWLERRVEPAQPGQPQPDPVWVLRFSGEDAAELVCFSGRYDLSVFEGFELGVNGEMLRGPIEASAGRAFRSQQLNVARIEVLSGGAKVKR